MNGEHNMLNLETLNEYFIEFYEYYGMNKTKNAFGDEWGNSTKEHLGSDNDWRIRLLKFFREGDSDSFFTTWNNYCSDSIEQNNVRPLEFYLQLYFIAKNWEIDCETTKKERLQSFRTFLDTKGELLSQISEFLPFYAFPYVPNPKSHPAYRELFESDWANELERKLSLFLETVSSEEQPLPKILFLKKTDDNSKIAQIRQLQNRLGDAEKRVSQAQQRFNKIQTDYQNLLGITTDLVDTLEAALRGEHIQGNVLQQICARLVATQRGSVVWPADSLDTTDSFMETERRNENFSYGAHLRQSLLGGKSEISTPRPKENDTQRLQLENGLFEIEFSKVKEALRTLKPRATWRLLQALRWRLTKVSVDQRELNLTAIITHDLLDLTLYSDHLPTTETVLGTCLTSDSSKVVEAISRITNALASLCRGRAYLSQNPGAVTLLTRQIFQVDGGSDEGVAEETVTRENLIGALQKLSLRRSMQTIMTNLGMVEWLIILLENTDDLSDYTLEYAVALFMNLCLRTSGKKRCLSIGQRVLKMLTELISHENTGILSYVNGALFSILTLPELQKIAASMDLEGILNCFMRDDQHELNRQFEFIIKQMHSTESPSQIDSADEDEEDDDEEDADQMEYDIDKDDESFEIINCHFGGRAPITFDSPANELIGDVLLKTDYKVPPKSESSRHGGRGAGGLKNMDIERVQHYETESVLNNAGLLRRPSTPGRHRGTRDSQIPQPIASKQRRETKVPASIAEESSQGSKRNTPNHHADMIKIDCTEDDRASGTQKKRTSQNSVSSLDKHPEYQKAFNSRPRILRTPEHKKVASSMDRGSSRGGDSRANSRNSRPRPQSGRSSMEFNRN